MVVGLCWNWNSLIWGGAGFDWSTPSMRDAAWPVVNGGNQTSTRPRCEETASDTKRRPAESNAMPEGEKMDVNEVGDGGAPPSLLSVNVFWPRTRSAGRPDCPAARAPAENRRTRLFPESPTQRFPELSNAIAP